MLGCVGGIRVAEVLAALSLTTDLASGVPFEKGLRTCAVATAFGRELGLAQEELSVVYHTGLVRAIGCTAHAPENADVFGDDVAFQAWLKEADLGDEAVLTGQLARFGAWEPARQAAMTAEFLGTAATAGTTAWRSACEVGRAVGPLLGLPGAVVTALDHVYERWDGRGIPGLAGQDGLPVPARIVHVAEQAVLAHAQAGLPGAVAEVSRRSGGHLDPDLARAFARSAEAALAPLAEPDILAAVVSAEPGTASLAGPDGLRLMCQALASVVDLKGRYLLGHSQHVADVAARAAGLAGLGPEQSRRVETAGLLHDIGRAGVPSSIWDQPGPLSAAAWERARLHTYWTSRVLERCPALAGLAPLAASHHERLDGSGYHRGVRAGGLPFEARLLAAADALCEQTEPRPGRPAQSLAVAAARLTASARAGELDTAAVAAVIEAAGLPRARQARPHDLTEREVDVLCLAARGLTNQQIAGQLSLSARTVGNHLAHVYDKTGHRTRAGAAVFAIQAGLLPAGGEQAGGEQAAGGR
jgi:HD-GYP domain-containing protein (c-di-GMP phosphodiesterase class II)